MRGAFSSWPWVMPLLVLTVRAAAWDSSARHVVELKVALEEIHRVDPRFLSVTIDASLAADPKYIAFLGPASSCGSSFLSVFSTPENSTTIEQLTSSLICERCESGSGPPKKSEAQKKS
ncbi:heparanase-like isoform X2 [Ambystoma mexicanum]|uniref:heparanase-like isoform X2 n=1 Tax=Ambystoma mexicanum TaxID=8296 RepID=UPI0037E79406